MTDFDWTLVPANMDYYRRSDVDKLIRMAKIEYQVLEEVSEKAMNKVLARYGELESRLTEADRLMIKHYPCYSETNCKKCVGDWDKIHYETCTGYNVIRALRGEAK